jgi:hypothetical protein
MPQTFEWWFWEDCVIHTCLLPSALVWGDTLGLSRSIFTDIQLDYMKFPPKKLGQIFLYYLSGISIGWWWLWFHGVPSAYWGPFCGYVFWQRFHWYNVFLGNRNTFLGLWKTKYSHPLSICQIIQYTTLCMILSFGSRSLVILHLSVLLLVRRGLLYGTLVWWSYI